MGGRLQLLQAINKNKTSPQIFVSQVLLLNTRAWQLTRLWQASTGVNWVSFKMFPLIVKVKSALVRGISLQAVSERRFTGLLRKQGRRGAALPWLAIHPRGLSKPCMTSRASPLPRYQLPTEMLSSVSPTTDMLNAMCMVSAQNSCFSAWPLPATLGTQNSASAPRSHLAALSVPGYCQETKTHPARWTRPLSRRALHGATDPDICLQIGVIMKVTLAQSKSI